MDKRTTATVARLVGKAQDLAATAEEIGEEIEDRSGADTPERRMCLALHMAALILLNAAEAEDRARAASASTKGVDLRRRIVAGL